MPCTWGCGRRRTFEACCGGFSTPRQSYSPLFTPEDLRIATEVGALNQLNCGTMGGLVPTRVLLVEAPDGLVLVDSGIGLLDIADPAGRLGAMRHAPAGPEDPACNSRACSTQRILALISLKW